MVKSRSKGALAVSEVYELCNEKRYFTSGSTSAYDKMFDLVREGRPLNEIAAIIWACSSNADYRQVYTDLEEVLLKDAISA